MLKKTMEFIKSPRFAEIFRFGVNGGMCAVVDAAVMYLLMKLTSAPDWLSIGIGFTVSVVLNYILCVLWVFKGAGKQDLKSQIIFIGSSVIGLVLTEILMLLALKIHIHALIAKVIVTLIVMVWNYFMKRIAIYGTNKKGDK